MLDLAVIESRWWKNGNSSVRGIFEMVADILKDNPNAWHYEMFNNKESIQEIIPRIAEKKKIKNLYIAAHGDRNYICGAEAAKENRISRTVLGNALSKIPRNSLDGLYLGTCLTANCETVGVLKASPVCWIAGYSKKTDWLESTMLDMYFWTTYYSVEPSQNKAKHIRKVAKKIKVVQGLCDKLGFDIWVRERGRGSRVTRLLSGDG